MDTPSKGFWLKCDQCGYCFVAAMYPMEMSRFLKLMDDARHCRRCGASRTHLWVARQSGGVLLEIANPNGPIKAAS